LCQALGARSVTEFNYRLGARDFAEVFLGLALRRGTVERNEVIEALQRAQFAVTDLTDNELAKLHVRYMVGGRLANLADERLFRFEFPERPGALLKFLQAIGSRWNISLFHYRNHGSDAGRVLAGIQVPRDSHDEFLSHLAALQYPWVEETDNPAYQRFLGT
jgi:threonine dehydratase